MIMLLVCIGPRTKKNIILFSSIVIRNFFVAFDSIQQLTYIRAVSEEIVNMIYFNGTHDAIL